VKYGWVFCVVAFVGVSCSPSSDDAAYSTSSNSGVGVTSAIESQTTLAASSGMAAAPTTTTAIAPPTTTAIAPTTTTAITPTTTTYPRVTSPVSVRFEELMSRVDDVPAIAWEHSQAILNHNLDVPGSSVELEVKIGPTTDLYFEENEKALRDGSAFWQGYDTPTRYIALFYNAADRPWAERQLVEYGEQSDRARARAGGPCPDEMTCTGANSGLGIGIHESTGVGVFGISQADSWDAYRTGGLQIHEYTHAVQPAAWVNNARGAQDESNRSAPCWLIEGSAHFTGISVAENEYASYLQLRNSQVRGRHLKGEFADYSSEKIFDYYNASVPYLCIGQKDYDLGYSVGFLTVEALSAVAGSQSSMDIYKSMSLGNSFEEAFQSVYEVSWDEAKSILATYVSLVIGRLFD